MRIGVAAPPMLPIPPRAYAGTERIVAALVDELVVRGHDVTLFASGDSSTLARLVPTVAVSTWTDAGCVESVAAQVLSAEIVARHAGGLDIVHSHLEGFGIPLARRLSVPVLSTLHLHPSWAGMPALLEAFPEAPLVAISESQRREASAAHWVATIHHGLPLHRMRHSEAAGDYLLLVGRATAEKGVSEAIEIARRTGLPLRIVAKVRETGERLFLERVIRPAEREGIVTFLGELDVDARDAQFAGALATLMMGDRPEPFGLVSIESMGAGTPVIGRRRGALPEIVRHGVDGFVVDDVEGAVSAVARVGNLDRRAIRRSALRRFSAGRMVDTYEATYRSLLGATARDLPNAAIPFDAVAPASHPLPLRLR